MIVFIQSNHCNRLPLDEKAWREGMKMLEIFAYCTVAAVHFTDQEWILKTVYRIRCMMACKIGFINWNAKIALLCASMVVTYYIKRFRTGADRHNAILMSLLLLVAETIKALIYLVILHEILLRTWTLTKFGNSG